MPTQELLERIAVHPDVMTGKPVIRGTDLTVDYICRRIARGATVAELLKEYPGLSVEDIHACLWYPQPTGPGGSPQPCLFNLGHTDDVDYTQIAQTLRLTPAERLERHEGWRLFAKEALRRAAIRQGHHHPAGGSKG
jgi:uncharacterized protein (DUF433 family)